MGVSMKEKHQALCKALEHLNTLTKRINLDLLWLMADKEDTGEARMELAKVKDLLLTVSDALEKLKNVYVWNSKQSSTTNITPVVKGKTEDRDEEVVNFLVQRSAHLDDDDESATMSTRLDGKKEEVLVQEVTLQDGAVSDVLVPSREDGVQAVTGKERRTRSGLHRRLQQQQEEEKGVGGGNDGDDDVDDDDDNDDGKESQTMGESEKSQIGDVCPKEDLDFNEGNDGKEDESLPEVQSLKKNWLGKQMTLKAQRDKLRVLTYLGIPLAFLKTRKKDVICTCPVCNKGICGKNIWRHLNLHVQKKKRSGEVWSNKDLDLIISTFINKREDENLPKARKPKKTLCSKRMALRPQIDKHKVIRELGISPSFLKTRQADQCNCPVCNKEYSGKSIWKHLDFHVQKRKQKRDVCSKKDPDLNVSNNEMGDEDLPKRRESETNVPQIETDIQRPRIDKIGITTFLGISPSFVKTHQLSRCICPLCNKSYSGKSIWRHLDLHVQKKKQTGNACPKEDPDLNVSNNGIVGENQPKDQEPKKNLRGTGNNKKRPRIDKIGITTFLGISPSFVKTPQLSRCICPLCNKSYSGKSIWKHLDLHVRRKKGIPKKEVLCSLCGKTVQDLRGHMRWHNMINRGDPVVVNDGEGDENLPQSQAPKKILLGGEEIVMKYRNHRRWKLIMELGVSPSLMQVPPEGTFVCPLCSKEYAGRRLCSHLHMHAREKRGEAVRELCSLCGQTVQDMKKHLQRHQIIESGVRVKCPHCPKDFHAKSYLRTHIRRVHGPNQRLICDVCGKEFRNDRYMKVHRRLVHSKQEASPCSICHKTFSTKMNLVRHMRIHTSTGAFPCATCDRIFSTKDNLYYHERKHISSFPFRCSLCDHPGFSTASRLQEHLEKKHGPNGEEREEVNKKDGVKKKRGRPRLSFPRNRQSASLPKVHKCNVCGKEFKQACNYYRHKHVHTGLKPFSCPVCARAFSQRAILDLHLWTHSPSKKYQCGLCDKGFNDRRHMVSHGKRDHPGYTFSIPKSFHEAPKEFQHLILGRRPHRKVSLPHDVSIPQDAIVSIPQDTIVSIPQEISITPVVSIPPDVLIPQDVSLPQNVSLTPVVSIPPDVSLPQNVSILQDISIPQHVSLTHVSLPPQDVSLTQVSLPQVVSIPQDVSLPQNVSLGQVSLPQVISIPQNVSLPQEVSFVTMTAATTSDIHVQL